MATKCDPKARPEASQNAEETPMQAATAAAAAVDAIVSPPNIVEGGKIVTGKATISVEKSRITVAGRQVITSFGLKLPKDGVPNDNKVTGEAVSELPPATRWRVVREKGKWVRKDGGSIEGMTHMSVQNSDEIYVHKEISDAKEAAEAAAINNDVGHMEMLRHEGIRKRLAPAVARMVHMVASINVSNAVRQHEAWEPLRMIENDEDLNGNYKRRAKTNAALRGKPVVLKRGEKQAIGGIEGITFDAFGLNDKGIADKKAAHNIAPDILLEVQDVAMSDGDELSIAGNVVSANATVVPEGAKLLEIHGGKPMVEGAVVVSAAAAFLRNGNVFLVNPEVVTETEPGDRQNLKDQLEPKPQSPGQRVKDIKTRRAIREVQEAKAADRAEAGVPPPSGERTPPKISKIRRRSEQARFSPTTVKQILSFLLPPERVFSDEPDMMEALNEIRLASDESVTMGKSDDALIKPFRKSWNKLKLSEQEGLGNLLYKYYDRESWPTEDEIRADLVAMGLRSDLYGIIEKTYEILAHGAKHLREHNEAISSKALMVTDRIIEYLASRGDAVRIKGILEAWRRAVVREMEHEQREGIRRNKAIRKKMKEEGGVEEPLGKLRDRMYRKMRFKDSNDAKGHTRALDEGNATLLEIAAAAAPEEAIEIKATIQQLRQAARRISNIDITQNIKGYMPHKFYGEWQVLRIEQLKDGKYRYTFIHPPDNLNGGFDSEADATEAYLADAREAETNAEIESVQYIIRDRQWQPIPRENVFLTPAAADRLQIEVDRAITEATRRREQDGKEDKKDKTKEDKARERQILDIATQLQGVVVSLEDAKSAAENSNARNRLRQMLAGESIQRRFAAAFSNLQYQGFSQDIARVLTDHMNGIRRRIYQDTTQFWGIPPLHKRGRTLSQRGKRDDKVIDGWALFVNDMMENDGSRRLGPWVNYYTGWQLPLLKPVKPGSSLDLVLKSLILRAVVFGLPSAAAFAAMGLSPLIPLIWSAAKGALIGGVAAKLAGDVIQDPNLKGLARIGHHLFEPRMGTGAQVSYSRVLASAENSLEIVFKLLGTPLYMAYAAQNILQIGFIWGISGTKNLLQGFARYMAMRPDFIYARLKGKLPDKPLSKHSTHFREMTDMLGIGQIGWEGPIEGANSATLMHLISMFGLLAGWSERTARGVAFATGLVMAEKEGKKALNDLRTEVRNLNEEAAALRENYEEGAAREVEMAAKRLWAQRNDKAAVAEYYAEHIIKLSQFNYNPTGRPSAFRTRAPFVQNSFQFKVFLVHAVDLMVKYLEKAPRDFVRFGSEANAPRVKAARLRANLAFHGWQVMVAGLIGAPLGLPLTALYWILPLLSGDDDDDVRRANIPSPQSRFSRDALATARRSAGGSAAMHGLITLLGVDISRSVGWQETMPFTAGGGIRPVRDFKLTSLLGPSAATDWNVTRSLARNVEGPGKSAQTIVGGVWPSMGKLFQGSRGLLTGSDIYRTTLGRPLFLDADRLDFVKQMGGLASTRAGWFYKMQQAGFIADEERDAEVTRLRIQYQRAVSRGDQSGAMEAQEAIRSLVGIGLYPGDLRERVDNPAGRIIQWHRDAAIPEDVKLMKERVRKQEQRNRTR